MRRNSLEKTLKTNMLLEFGNQDEMYFADRKIPVIDVLNPDLKYKICVRFDGALELVDAGIDGGYWIPDPKFNWNLTEKFNALTPKDFSDPWGRRISFFVGHAAFLKKSSIRYFKYTSIDCDYIEGIGKETTVSGSLLQLITDKRSTSNDKIGYCILRNGRNRKEDICVQSFHPIDVHFHSDEGWYSQGVLFNRHTKNRLVLMGEQNMDVGALAIPELYFEQNYMQCSEQDVIFHEQDYVKEFIEHNLVYCEEAKDFYVPQDPNKHCCKDCMKIAQHLIEQNQNFI